MVRNPSRITSSHPAEVSNDQQLSTDRVPQHGNAKAPSAPKSRPSDQRTVPDRLERTAYPAWVHSRGPGISAKSLKTEPEQLTTSEDYLTCSEVAAVLRVSLRTVRRLIALGRIPHIRIGRQVRIPRKGLADG